MSSEGLGTDDLVQALNDLSQFFRAHDAVSWADSSDSHRTDLIDLEPGLLWKVL